MDIFKIRKEANILAYKNAAKIIPTYVFVEFVLLSLLTVSNQIISIILGLLLSTITHAYIVSSLKIVEKKEFKIKDAFVGLRGYSRLFPSYFMRKLMVNLVSILVLLPTILLIQKEVGFTMTDLLEWLQMIVVSGIEKFSTLSSISNYLTSPIIYILFFVASIITSLVSYGLTLMPYLVEKQEISWNEAILKSWKMMKGHKRELFYLRLTFLPQILLIVITIQLVSNLLSFSLFLTTFISLVLSIYLPIMLYQPHLEIANALFYKELIEQEKHPDLFVL